MRIFAIALAAFTMLPGACLAADGDDTDAPTVMALDDAAFDAQFRCPETLADADARLDEIQRYQAWTHERHPEWDLRKRQDVRFGLLHRHACAATWAKVIASTKPAF